VNEGGGFKQMTMIMEFNQWKSSMPVLVMLGALNKHITLLVAQQSCWVHHKIQLAEISGAALFKIEPDNILVILFFCLISMQLLEDQIMLLS